MLYKLAHVLRDKFPFLWRLLGKLNAMLFALRYKNRLIKIPAILKRYSTDFCIEPLEKNNIADAALFFNKQPEDAFTFFRPHGFGKGDLLQLCADKSFLAYIVRKNDEVVGYFFLRCSFMGKAYRGYMTDVNHRRMGINKLMGLCATDIAVSLNLPMFGSIAPDNVASMKSAETVNDIRIIEALDNGDFLVEYLPKK